LVAAQLQQLDEESWQAAAALARVIPSCPRTLQFAMRDFTADEFTESEISGAESLPYIFEHWLASQAPGERRRFGVYFTPRAVAEFLVERTDEVLRREFDIKAGLADQTHDLHILDPALGSGVFLLAAIDRVQRTLFDHWHAQGQDSRQRASLWDTSVRERLLPRMHGVEILPEPLTVAHLLIGFKLAEAGFRPRAGDVLRLHCGDALASPDSPELWHVPRNERPPNETITVVLGNPPYSGVSAGDYPWISALLRGRGPDGRSAASYYHVAGEPINERKHWLNDDYVKFFRFAQWQIESSGAGVLAFVTNRGFLDNPTFRGMRHGLLQTFERIEVIDLHGNVNGSKARGDESIFETAQGMALTLAWRTRGGRKRRPQVRRGELRGSRAEKLAALEGARRAPLRTQALRVDAPYFLFCEHDASRDREWASGYCLCDIMPVNTTAAVTARDSFAIDADRNALIARLSEFRDLRITEDVIRQKYFQNTRSRKHAPGDTRGWKLAEARRRLAAEEDWQQHIRTCWYRPFDRRWIFWTPWMIDWPRSDVMRHFRPVAWDSHPGLMGEAARDGNPRPRNLALVCRRQMPRGRPCNYFWVADDIVIDGYIRSDNRGSESVFPLQLLAGEVQVAGANFTAQFLNDVVAIDNSPDVACRAFHYIYALFHARTYRERYADNLRVGFPRIFLPAAPSLFRQLVALGRQLVPEHLLANDGRGPSPTELPHFAPLAESQWQFHVGAYQVLRKWVKDRRGRELTSTQRATYARIAGAVGETLGLMDQIEQAINDHGGWPAAFKIQ
jgi:hypothetical protein